MSSVARGASSLYSTCNGAQAAQHCRHGLTTRAQLMLNCSTAELFGAPAMLTTCVEAEGHCMREGVPAAQLKRPPLAQCIQAAGAW